MKDHVDPPALRALSLASSAHRDRLTGLVAEESSRSGDETLDLLLKEVNSPLGLADAVCFFRAG